MDEQEDLIALLGEFMPDEDEMQRQIEAEWERMHAAGETIRVGDAPALLAYRWAERYGIPCSDALRRRFGVRDEDEDEDE